VQRIRPFARRIPQFGRHSPAKRNEAGSAFTLIELMVVIVILGILIALVGPKILGRTDDARRAAARVQIRNLQSALALFKLDTGRYPTTGEGLTALIADPGVKNWRQGGYMENDKVPADPWGNAYIYTCPGTNQRDFDIVSYGPTGQPGGTGKDAPIESWNLEAN